MKFNSLDNIGNVLAKVLKKQDITNNQEQFILTLAGGSDPIDNSQIINSLTNDKLLSLQFLKAKGQECNLDLEDHEIMNHEYESKKTLAEKKRKIREKNYNVYNDLIANNLVS